MKTTFKARSQLSYQTIYIIYNSEPLAIKGLPRSQALVGEEERRVYSAVHALNLLEFLIVEREWSRLIVGSESHNRGNLLN